jgi:hypothetical protein
MGAAIGVIVSIGKALVSIWGIGFFVERSRKILELINDIIAKKISLKEGLLSISVAIFVLVVVIKIYIYFDYGYIHDAIRAVHTARCYVSACGNGSPNSDGKTTDAAAKDEKAWTAAQQADTIEAYESYLNTVPSGAHAADAKSRISPQRIAIGEWAIGSWYTSEFEAHANIRARLYGNDNFKLFINSSRSEIRNEGGGKVLYIDGKRVSYLFDDMQYVRHGANAGADIVAVNVKRGDRWTVAVDGHPWDTWFDSLYQYSVINNGVAIGVERQGKWTIAVNGKPWSQWFDAVENYSIFADGSVIAEVESNGRSIIVRNGIEDRRLPLPKFVRISTTGKIAWIAEDNNRQSVVVDWTMKWKSNFSEIVGLVIDEYTSKVIAEVRSNNKITLVTDDVPWPHWHESDVFESDVYGFGICHSSGFMRVHRYGLWSLVVNDKTWGNWFDEIGAIGCEQSGIVSAAVQKNGMWSVARDGHVLNQWFPDLRGWAISPDGSLIAVAAAEKSNLGITRWKVAIFPIAHDLE